MSMQCVILYKYAPIKYVAETLNNNRIYLNGGRNFNDPFEITVADNHNKEIRRLEGLHILSLTNSYRKKLMWSHYTESHQGVCLTVKVPRNLVYPICYSSRRVYEDSNVAEIIASSQRKLKNYHTKNNISKDYSSLSRDKKIAYIKDKKWMYENEYRIVFDRDDERYLISEDNNWFMPVKVTNVYLGVNFDKNQPEIKDEIMNACKRNKIKVAQMILSDSDYSINVKR